MQGISEAERIRYKNQVKPDQGCQEKPGKGDKNEQGKGNIAGDHD